MSNLDPRGAKDLIQRIRRSRHVDDEDDWNAGDLSRSLEILSDQLYSTQTHFLFELVQNADDLEFEEDVTPKLVLVYRQDGFLWVGSNEIGFKEENVNAICRLQLSTKSVRQGQKEKIGEKGIGFKSVFKVADKVWISSHPFYFRFDRDGKLGMVTPIWDEDFPENNALEEQTMFCLRIPKQKDREAVQNHLVDLQPDLPLFLRNVREIQVIIQDVDENEYANFIVKRERWNSVAPHVDVVLREENFVEEAEEVKMRLIMEEKVTTSMPSEERRKNVTQSKLQMGFPVQENGLPHLANQDLYNFLPVRAYGLPFLLNGDFLLSASREDVDQGKEWNETLVKAAAELFLQSVRRFNNGREGLLKYEWPRYTRSQGTSRGTALDKLIPGILQLLRSKKVLQSQAGTFEVPNDLTHVPLKYTNGSSPPTPLLAIDGNLRPFLASEYSFQDVADLGVQSLVPRTFFAGLRRQLQTSANAIYKQAQTWHSRVAKAITNQVSWDDAKSIKIIPLRGGTWTSASCGNLYFPELDEGLEVPPGINISVIAQDAAAESARRAMYKWLGANDLNVAEVCRLVLDRHEKDDHEWETEHVVSHAWYLFRASATCRLDRPARLRFAEQGTGHLYYATAMYLDHGGPFHAWEFREYLPDGPRLFHILDTAYANKASPELNDAWVAWLRSLGIWSIPRLAQPFGRRLTPEFKSLLERIPSQRILQLLTRQWDDYRPYFSDDIRKELGESLVECLDGSRHRLKDCFLPKPQLLSVTFAMNTLPFVDTEENEHWESLSEFGVGTRANLRFYATILKNIKHKPYIKPTKEEIIRLYSKIQTLIEKYPNSSCPEVKDAIFIPTDQPRWVSPNGCVWNAPTSFQRIPVLSRYYPDFTLLFSQFLRIRDAQIEDVVSELHSIAGQASCVHIIKDLLKTLNKFLKAGSNHDRIDSLRGAAVLPIRSVNGDVSLRRCNDNSIEWFIADRERLRSCFFEKLDILDFSVADIERLVPLWRRLHIEQKYLGGKVSEMTLTRGRLQLEPSAQYMIRSKAEFMSRLVIRRRRATMKEQLAGAEVFSTADLVLRRTVRKSSGQEIYADDVGRVRVRTDEDHISVYLNAEDTNSGKYPWYLIKEELSRFFEIPQNRREFVLGILTMDDPELIEDMLERNNVLTESESDARVDQDHFDYEAPPQPVPGVRQEGIPATPTSSEAPSRITTPVSNYDSSPRPSTPASQTHQLRHRAPSSRGETFLSPSPIPRGPSGRSRAGSTSTSTYYVIDPSRIEAAAETFRSEHIVGVSAAEATASSRESTSLLAAVSAPPLTPNARGTGHSQSASIQSSFTFTVGEVEDGPFSFSDLRQALPSITPSRSFSPSPSETPSRDASPSPSSAPIRPSPSTALRTPSRNASRASSQSPGGGGYEREIGYGGELFVRLSFPHPLTILSIIY
ncbi:hypothetical protein EV356DRAFT_576268 [Viridothelium virens]|uniref:Heterokaryon incompatibility domain-containing protein n=1 Tax=Viridothelium virens TaxID=1048519 RepID=A0A6A6HAB6_VIRVR|nr:hypothetical protein EV356DRAFT_576268 [Viridothelium virens]